MSQIPQLTEDLAFISKLGDNPNTDDGMSSADLKAEFDKAPQRIQEYINKYIIPVLNKFLENGKEYYSTEEINEILKTYSHISHTHDGEYAPDPHNHNGIYAEIEHYHHGEYVRRSSDVMEGPLTLNGVYLTEGEDYGTALPSKAFEGKLFFKKENVGGVEMYRAYIGNGTNWE